MARTYFASRSRVATMGWKARNHCGSDDRQHGPTVYLQTFMLAYNPEFCEIWCQPGARSNEVEGSDRSPAPELALCFAVSQGKNPTNNKNILDGLDFGYIADDDLMVLLHKDSIATRNVPLKLALLPCSDFTCRFPIHKRVPAIHFSPSFSRSKLVLQSQ